MHTKFKEIKVVKEHKFVILIPSYKSDDIIFETIEHALNQDYPKHLFDVVLVGDSLREETEQALIKLPIIYFPVKFEISTKAKSINHALAVLPNVYDYCVVLDVDNIINPEFLYKMNKRLQNGEIIVQGHRTAKNLNSAFAILDAISEEINNSIFRRGHIAVGLSSSLSGSGKAMRYDLFKKAMADITSPVEDKELETFLLRNKIFIHYEDHALIYDEKVASAQVFTNQRKRWVASQFFAFNQVLLEGLINLFVYGNWDFFDKSIQRIILPRVLLLGLSFFFALTVFSAKFMLGKWFLLLFLICFLSYLVAVPSRFFTGNIILAALRLPQAFTLMLIAAIKSKGASKVFIHTPKMFKSK